MSRICSKSLRVSVWIVCPTRKEEAENRLGSRPMWVAKFWRNLLNSFEESAFPPPERTGALGSGGYIRTCEKINETRQKGDKIIQQEDTKTIGDNEVPLDHVYSQKEKEQ